MTDTTATISEIAESFVWIRARLLASPELVTLIGDRVFQGVAPLDTTYPFITMQLLDPGDDKRMVGAHTLWSAPLFLVRATINESSILPLSPIVSHINKQLHAQSGQTTLANIVSCIRERPHAAPQEEYDGIFYSHAGGEYRIQIRPRYAL